MDRTTVEKVSYQGKVQTLGTPAVILKKSELIQQFLCWMLMLSISCIDECRFAIQAVSLGVG
ncbi:hypothetical protein SDC9_140319 [bioreactor metagenome]|uniref:Uncharacterized protein n=1 Tax=bioreactor metagenome TaxID=1076179 RepID=A0A645DX50_9ZZZZ